MNKWLKFLSIMLLSFVFLAACGNDEGAEENESSNTSVSTNESSGEAQELAEDEVRITITIDEGNENVSEEVVQVEEGDILLDVMKDTFYVEEDSGFITSIERVSDDADEGKYWMYFVDGEAAEVGAGEYELNGGEEIIFDLQSME
ncbi:hypothetical protein J18TS1_02700 [Oceanobacillus oncorhynchi subsp. incaldanensis]|uniref:Transcobalamin-like C-terminal domain-containing protein n=2 Tax=Oceanobacillus TaxID=182709 RepID=A0A0A1MEJ2_9BACI|nr:DUF4430 domain-containing protein [Oceanobacillus oncorhynchi]MDM8101631.1 DUF4430 domain-containing protein [Oceanobacillus oncorhynchi]UUI38124.1 DUF4430 domain-containing protein [Oceanobacillus oncorhynchi]GIO17170.1 hypothetical protein J18TS1_02700 [Oceanobacillus oncorhynchi subsp. incaldanensis]CEI83780.1 hypothetical protein BN997_03701 [Oceanobacillus oncorhynchi]